MNTLLTEKADLFTANRLKMQQGFSWEYPAMNGLVAMLYTVYGKELDIDLIRSCRRVMRPKLAEQGLLEDPGIIAASAMISLADDPVEAYRNTNILYGMFLEKGFKPSLYILLASINIAKHHVDGEFAHMVEKAAAAYRYLESIYSIDAYGLNQTYKETLAVTFSEDGAEAYTKKASYCFGLLRDQLPNENAAMILTDTILATQRDIDETCRIALRLLVLFKQKGYEWREDFQYAITGVLAALCERKTIMVEEVLEAVDYLQHCKTVAEMGLVKDHYLTYACLLIELVYIEKLPDITTEQVEQIFIDMNIAMIVSLVEEAPHIVKY